jgi:hypothetical protein
MTRDEAWQQFCEEKMPQRRDYKFPQEGAFWDCWVMAWRSGYLEGLKSITKDKEYLND